jgi:hypothetical protein
VPILVISSDSYNSCNPNVPLYNGLPCLYLMAVQSQYSTSGPLEFYLTVSTSSSLRTVRNGQTISSVLAAGSVDHWQLSASSYTGTLQMLAAASFTQGQAVLYGSDTSLPTVSSAQQLVDAQPGFISYNVSTSDAVYYFVTVNCSAVADCVYSMMFQRLEPDWWQHSQRRAQPRHAQQCAAGSGPQCQWLRLFQPDQLRRLSAAAV